jgi:hypothetical protein
MRLVAYQLVSLARQTGAALSAEAFSRRRHILRVVALSCQRKCQKRHRPNDCTVRQDQPPVTSASGKP